MSDLPPKDKGGRTFRQRSWWVKLTVIAILLPVLIFALSNLWLISWWGTELAEDKLKSRTGMDWQVQSVTWSPWNGVTVNNAVMLQPESLDEDLKEPLMAVERINAKPYWGQLLRGNARFSEVLIDSPEFVLPVEILAELAAGSMNQEKVEVSDSPVAKPSTAKKNAEPQAKPKTTPDGSKPKVKKPVKRKMVQKPQEEVKPERPPVGMAMQIRVKDASVRVVSETKGIDLFAISGIDLDLPVLGEDAEGVIKLGELKVPGMKSIHNIQQKVAWKRPYLEMMQESLVLGGVDIKWMARLGVSRGAPFLVDFIIEPQSVEHFELLDHLALDAKVEGLSGRFKAAGSLPKPMSWRASMVARSDSVTVLERHGGGELYFDEVSVPAIFQQGELSWQSARVIGEDASLLGNGQISFRNGVNSVTRLVVSPEIAAELHSAMIGAGLLASRRPWWEDLETPDRKYRDIHVTGKLNDPSIDISVKHEDLPLWQNLAGVLDFIRMEMSEEGVTLKPLPNENFFNN